MFAHLVPIRTPGALMPFIVIIERIRRIIRPLTLAIRLSANMIAGHLLLTLLGNQLANLRMLGLILPTEITLVVLEIAVSLIQAYVFSILIALYIREVSEESH
jgi:F-type H+-transporting ATPase subunit a